jgi:magnesium and cobalt exporter, CNNM family
MNLGALPELGPRLFLMLGLIMCSGFFAGSETSLFSLPRLTRERLARSASSTDRYVTTLLRDPRRLIVTILVGNELINITFSSLAATVVKSVLPAAGEVALILATTALTVPMLLLVGEITPKSIALRVAERWAKLAARPLGLFALLVTPIRAILNAVAGAVVRLLGGGSSAPLHRPIDEAEFRALVDVGSEEGTLEATERRLIHNVFQFGDRTVAEIMTPARKVFSLSYELPLLRLVSEVARSGLSRIPVYRGRKEDVVGILFAKDLVGTASRLKGRTVKDLLHAPMYVPKTTKCDRLFREFQRKRTHLALVVDEYGRLVGLVTMEDLLVALFGPVREEKERAAARAARNESAGEPAGDAATPPPPAPPDDRELPS